MLSICFKIKRKCFFLKEDRHWFWPNAPFPLDYWHRPVLPFLTNDTRGVAAVHRESTACWRWWRNRSGVIFSTAGLINISELCTPWRFTEHPFSFFALAIHGYLTEWWSWQEFLWEFPWQALWRKVDKLELYNSMWNFVFAEISVKRWSPSGTGILTCASGLFRL